MGRAPCCAKVGLHRGPWTAQEDSLLTNYIHTHGEGLWRSLPKKAGLLRCGKSCRLRWLNYLRPDIKRGNISPEEDELIIKLHALLGNKWSLIAGRLPGRTDNEIKNYWNTHLVKKLKIEGTDPNTHKKMSELVSVPPKRRRSNTKKTKTKKEDEKKVETGNELIPTHIHIPKAVRVTSMKRSHSLASLESLVTNVSGSEEAAYWASSDVYGATENPHASDLDKLYEEYLQLLNMDHDYVDENQARELDSFAQSLLI